MKDQMEVCPLVRGVMSPNGSTPIRPITGRHSLSPSSLTRNAIELTLRRVYPARGALRAYHVSCSYPNRWVRSRLFAGGRLVCVERQGSSATRPHAFWLKPISVFGLLDLTTFNSGSLALTLPSFPSPRPP